MRSGSASNLLDSPYSEQDKKKWAFRCTRKSTVRLEYNFMISFFFKILPQYLPTDTTYLLGDPDRICQSCGQSADNLGYLRRLTAWNLLRLSTISDQSWLDIRYGISSFQNGRLIVKIFIRCIPFLISLSTLAHCGRLRIRAESGSE